MKQIAGFRAVSNRVLQSAVPAHCIFTYVSQEYGPMILKWNSHDLVGAS